MTIPTQLVLHALLTNPAKELYGVEIGTAAGLPSGTVHPILARLESMGWLPRAGRPSTPGPRAARPAATTSSPPTA